MTILVFKRMYSYQEAEALTKLANGAIYNSHHNWERNVDTTFENSNPSKEVCEVAQIISSFIRKPAYCFIFATGQCLASTLISIKEPDNFLGVISEKIEADSIYRNKILEKVNDLSSIIHYDALKSDGDDMDEFAQVYLKEINNLTLQRLMSLSDKNIRKEAIHKLMNELRAVNYFEQ